MLVCRIVTTVLVSYSCTRIPAAPFFHTFVPAFAARGDLFITVAWYVVCGRQFPSIIVATLLIQYRGGRCVQCKDAGYEKVKRLHAVVRDNLK